MRRRSTLADFVAEVRERQLKTGYIPVFSFKTIYFLLNSGFYLNFAAIDDTYNVIVDSGCHTHTKFLPGYDAEICICSGSWCNEGSSLLYSASIFQFLSLAFVVLLSL